MIKLVDEGIEASNLIFDEAIKTLTRMKEERRAIAITMQIQLNDGRFLRYKDLQAGTNYLTLIGALECAKLDIIDDTREL